MGAWVWVAGYIGSIVAANWATAAFGLVPIGFGLMVTAGTFAAGAAMILRDGIQQTSPRWAVPVAILVGAALSYVLAGPALAFASGVAFLVSELADWAVYSPVRGRSVPLAVLASSVVAAPIDTAGFLWLAEFPVTWPAIIGQFLVKTGMAGLVALWLARRSK
jgi:hypothetical protein